VIAPIGQPSDGDAHQRVRPRLHKNAAVGSPHRRIAASPHRRIADLLDQAAQPVDQGLTLHTQPA